MSINKIECSNGRLTLHGDYVVFHQDDVQFELEGDGIPGFLKGSRRGNVFISTNRVIFAPQGNSNVGSFSMTFQSIRNVEVKQPMFGANYIKGDVISEPEGGWQGRGTFKIIFSSGGAIEFAERFSRAVQTARRPGQTPPMQPAGQRAAFAVYNPYPPPVPQPGYYYGAPAGPPGAGPTYYPPNPPVGFMGQPPPYHPPENPPPYPGQATPSAPPSDSIGNTQEGAKAREAYSSGQNVYVPANQYPPYAPPPYTRDKKND